MAVLPSGDEMKNSFPIFVRCGRLVLRLSLITIVVTLTDAFMTGLFYLVPAAAVAALFFAWRFFRQMMKESEGTATMKEIALYVRKGAIGGRLRRGGRFGVKSGDLG